MTDTNERTPTPCDTFTMVQSTRNSGLTANLATIGHNRKLLPALPKL